MSAIASPASPVASVAPKALPTQPAATLSALTGVHIGRVSYNKSGFASNPIQLVVGDTAVGSPKGYRSAFDARDAIAKLTRGADVPAAAVVKLGETFHGVSLLAYDDRSFVDRASRKHEIHDYEPANLEKDAGYKFGQTSSKLAQLAWVVDGDVSLAGPELIGKPSA